MRIIASRHPWSEFVEIHVIEDRRDGPHRGVLSFEPFEEGAFVEKTAAINQDAAQQLMDQLWSCGVRPTQGAGSAGSLAATEKHLKDMQDIAKGLLRKSGIEI